MNRPVNAFIQETWINGGSTRKVGGAGTRFVEFVTKLSKTTADKTLRQDKRLDNTLRIIKYPRNAPRHRRPTLSNIYRRQGIELSRTTLGRWSGAVSELLRQYVLMPGKVHTDDIPVPVQEPAGVKPVRPGCGFT